MKKNKKTAFPVPQNERTESYWKQLNRVLDPELGIGIVDLGLIYAVDIDTKGTATVTMTLTSMGCPAGPEIMRRIEVEMGKVSGVKHVVVELVWEPVWGQDLVSPDVRELMF